MKEVQVREELSGKSLRRLEEEIRREREAGTKAKKGQARIGQDHEPHEKSPESHPRLFIPLKRAVAPRSSEALIPHLHTLLPTFLRLGIINTKPPSSFPLIPILRVLEKPLQDVRIQVYEPLRVLDLKCSSPRLKSRPHIDQSIRPLLRPLALADLGFCLPRLALRQRLMRLKVLPAPRLECEEFLIPMIRTAGLLGAKEVRKMRQVEEASLKREVGFSSTQAKAEEPSRTYEEDIFIPPILEAMSSMLKPIARPICIVVPKKEDDSFVRSIAIMCREVYRIIEGGRPKPRWISEELKEEIEERLRAENTIFVVDDSKCKLLPSLSNVSSCKDLLNKVKIEVVLDRLREFFSQGFGFVIFHVNERWAGQFANLLREKGGTSIDIVEVQVPELQSQAKALLARVCWGFVERKGETFDDVFESCEKTFFDELSKADEDIELSHYIEKDENAGPEHEGMKIVVAECLARELGARSRGEVVRMLEEGRIVTEYKLDGGRADIYVPSQERFIEIETFYGTGNPIDKLDKETLRKYLLRCRGTKCRVDVVLQTGLQNLLYDHKLVKLAEIYRKVQGVEVDFYL